MLRSRMFAVMAMVMAEKEEGGMWMSCLDGFLRGEKVSVALSFSKKGMQTVVSSFLRDSEEGAEDVRLVVPSFLRPFLHLSMFTISITH